MKAIFKQENPNVLIIRDADKNEASLLIGYLNKIKQGADIISKAAFNGNQEVNGIVFEVKEKIVEPETRVSIKVNATVTNRPEDLPVFRIELLPESSNYNSFKVDTEKWNDLKAVLETLGVVNLSITSGGDIVGANYSGVIVDGVIVIPSGLLQYVDLVNATTNSFNDNVKVILGEGSTSGTEGTLYPTCPFCGLEPGPVVPGEPGSTITGPGPCEHYGG